jgi:hypothetical protein
LLIVWFLNLELLCTQLDGGLPSVLQGKPFF